MFEDVVQLVLRNPGSQGYETIYSSTEVEIDNELLPFLLPRSKTSPSFPNYYFKYPINHDFTLIKLVQDDGVDNYNRFKAKVHLFLVPKHVYEQVNGLLFFASPLWLNTISMDMNYPLNYAKDFDIANEVKKKFETSVSKAFLTFLLDKMLFYEHLIIMLEDRDNYQDRIFIMQTLAYLDSKIPSFMRNQITIKTLTNKNNFDIANCLLLDHYDSDLPVADNSFVFPFSSKILDKVSELVSSKLANAIMSIENEEEKESIGRDIFNSKKLVKDELVTNEEFHKLAKRFNIKDTKILTKFFRNFGLR